MKLICLIVVLLLLSTAFSIEKPGKNKNKNKRSAKGKGDTDGEVEIQRKVLKPELGKEIKALKKEVKKLKKTKADCGKLTEEQQQSLNKVLKGHEKMTKPKKEELKEKFSKETKKGCKKENKKTKKFIKGLKRQTKKLKKEYKKEKLETDTYNQNEVQVEKVNKKMVRRRKALVKKLSKPNKKYMFMKLGSKNRAREASLDGPGIATACSAGFFNNVPPSLCWKRGLDAGIIPTGCPAGYHRVLALCFEDCRPGFVFDGLAMCRNSCPTNYTSYWLTCTYWKWWPETIAREVYFPPSMTNFDTRIPCPADMYRGGALCYRDCAKVLMVNCGIGMCAASVDACIGGIFKMVVDVLIGVAQLVLLLVSLGSSTGASGVMNQLKASGKGIVAGAQKGIRSGLQLMKNLSKVPAVRNQLVKATVKSAAKSLGVSMLEFGMESIAYKAINEVCSAVSNALIDQAGEEDPDRVVFIPENIDIIGLNDTFNACSKVGTKDSTHKDDVSCAGSILGKLALVDPTGLMGIASALMHPTCDI